MISDKMIRDNAVSEIVAVILLIGLVISGAALVLVMMISNPPPEKIPTVNIEKMSSSDPDAAYFLNSGGDFLSRDQIVIRTYDNNGLVEEYTADDLYIVRKDPTSGNYINTIWKDLPEGTEWDYGSYALIPDKGFANSFHVLYKTENSEYLLKKFGEGSAHGGTPDIPVCDPPIDATFTRDNTGLEYTFTPSNSYSASDGYKWGWTISGQNYLKSISSLIDGSITHTFPLPPGTGSNSYSVRRWVAKYEDNKLLCEDSDVITVPVSCSDSSISADFSWRYYPIGSNFVQFTDHSSGPYDNSRSEWEFIGGHINSYTGATPTAVQFTGDGPYYVTLTIFGDRCGKEVKSTATKQIAGPSCTVSTQFTSGLIDCDPVTNTWTEEFLWTPNSDLISKEYDAVWDFGDGTDKIVRNNIDWPIAGTVTHRITHPFSGFHSYPVTFTVKVHGCPVYESSRIVSPSQSCVCQIPPNADFDLSIISTNPLRIQVEDLSSPGEGRNINRYEWNYGDGTINPDPIQLEHEYSLSHHMKEYPVTLKIWDTYGCVGERTRTVSSTCPTPRAEFDYDIDSTDPKRVHFTVPPGTDLAYQWSFGDGESSSDPNPTHTYTELKQYTVHLKITDQICGTSDTTTRDIQFLCPKITPSFTLRKTGENTIELTDNSELHSDIVRWIWDFGDSTPQREFDQSSYQKVISYEYTTPGEYVITLTIENECKDKESTHQSINCPPIGNLGFTPLVSTGDAPHTVNFQLTEHGTSTRWIWSFGDGNSIERTNTEPISHTYERSGTYQVTLTAYSECGSSAVKTGQVTVTCPPVEADFAFVPTIDKVSNRLSVEFTDISPSPDDITQWRWDFGDGHSVTWDRTEWEAASGVYTHPYPKIAPYTAKLTVSNDCGSTDSKTWLINSETSCPDIIANFTPLYTEATAPHRMQFTDTSENATRWSWDFGDGHPSEEQNPLHEYKNAGRYVVTLTAINECGMSASKTGVVNISCQDVTADFGLEYLAADVATNNLTVRFTDVSQGYGLDIMKWRWDFGDGIKTSWTQATRPVNGQVDHTYPKVAPYTASLEVENECGSVDKVHKLVYNGSQHCEDIVANFTPLISSGDAPLTINFVDQTTGEPNRWHWDFGDDTFGELQKSSTVTKGDISHTYEKVGKYVVTLIATGECGKAGVKSGYVTIDCPEVNVDFGYTYLDEHNRTVNFNAFVFPPLYDDDIIDWTWFFDDGTTGKGQSITHTYGPNTEEVYFNVLVVATSYCGTTGQNLKILYPSCPELFPDFSVIPPNGSYPLEVTVVDNSSPLQDIVSWRWFFGDGGYYYSTDPLQKEPPEPHLFSNWGIFPITLQIQNKCGNIFSAVREVEVTDTARIYGYIWADNNMNHNPDTGDWPLTNWPVTLEEQVNGIWQTRETTQTNETGWYEFPLEIGYGVFRVVEDLPDIWNVTTSYGVTRSGVDRNPVTGRILIYSDREFRADFGNVAWHVSSMQLPRGWHLPDGSLWDYSTETNRIWNFFRSYDPMLFLIPGSNWITYNGQRVYQVPPYGKLGNSAFNITMPGGLVNTDNRNPPTLTNSRVVGRWIYSGPPAPFTTLGRTFEVPDNISILHPPGFTGNNLRIELVQATDAYTYIYPPYEGQVIPYDQNFGRYDGLGYAFTSRISGGGNTITVDLLTPFSRQLAYTNTPYINWNLGPDGWDNRAFEGQDITFTTRTNRNPGTSIAVRNVTVGYQPLVPTILDILLNSPTIGEITVNANVQGHNYDPLNVYVVVGNATTGENLYQMTWTGTYAGGNRSTVTFDSEPISGNIIPFSIRATPRFYQGKYWGERVDSAPQYVLVPSLNPIQANFTAEPWTGPAPLEVSFHDLSTGGPIYWDWNFGDGKPNITGSTLQVKNPVHIFDTAGNFPVTLTVRNILNQASSYQALITVPDNTHQLNLFTSRTGTLTAGRYIRWIVQGSNSHIVVNGSTYSLNNNDLVQLNLLSPVQNAEIQIANSIITCNLPNIQLVVNGVILDQGDCTGINIEEYRSIQSTLQYVALRDSTSWTNLVWGGSPVIVPTNRNLEINTIIPNTNRYLSLVLKTGEGYIDGNALTYRIYRV